MNNSKPTPFQIIIISLDVIIVFLLSVLGNQITLNISRTFLIVSIGILLLISIFIISARSFPEFLSMLPIERLQKTMPKTMAGIFPLGVLMGFVVGVFTASDQSPWFSFYTNNASGDITSEIYLSAFAIVVGLVIAVLFATIINRYLAGAMFSGYMFGLPIATSIIRPANNDLVASLLANLCLGIPLTLVIIFIIPNIKKFINSINEPRI